MAVSVTIPAWGQGPHCWHIPLAPAEDSAAAGSAYSAKLFLKKNKQTKKTQKQSAQDGFCTAGPRIFHAPATISQGSPQAEISAENPSPLPFQVQRFEGISRLPQDLWGGGNGVVAQCPSTVSAKSRGEEFGGRVSCSPMSSIKGGCKTHPVRWGFGGAAKAELRPCSSS